MINCTSITSAFSVRLYMVTPHTSCLSFIQISPLSDFVLISPTSNSVQFYFQGIPKHALILINIPMASWTLCWSRGEQSIDDYTFNGILSWGHGVGGSSLGKLNLKSLWWEDTCILKGDNPPQFPGHTEHSSTFLLIPTVNNPMASQRNPFLRLSLWKVSGV